MLPFIFRLGRKREKFNSVWGLCHSLLESIEYGDCGRAKSSDFCILNEKSQCPFAIWIKWLEGRWPFKWLLHTALLNEGNFWNRSRARQSQWSNGRQKELRLRWFLHISYLLPGIKHSPRGCGLEGESRSKMRRNLWCSCDCESSRIWIWTGSIWKMVLVFYLPLFPQKKNQNYWSKMIGTGWRKKTFNNVFKNIY